MRSPLALPPVLLVALGVTLGCASGGERGDPCLPDDIDGVIGGSAEFVVTVDDDSFTPRILTAQNRADVAIELTNAGTAPLGLLVDCLPTPNDDGCPAEACFPPEARLEPLAPGASATLRFEVPYAEGIYRLRAAEGRDVPEGQFIVK